ncbi:putative gustatory receptor 58b [Zeugodacus cucurbitae]|uniref:putative gustatory receptor 58b n=1 Tax=Zeugodacus cucurbitae TaxID=28588 RepID=UPI0023D95747|nr:putative gustatory receptor 58b [Zeugodacus cucurbitae]
MLPPHLQHAALRFVLRLSYYHALAFGLLPTCISYKHPLRTPRHTVLYQLYTAVIYLLCWAAYPVLMLRMTIDLVHLRGWLAVLFSLSIGLICKSVALATMYAYILFGRLRAIETLRFYRALRQRYRHIKGLTCHRQAQFECQLLAKFVIASVGIVFTARIFFMYGETNTTYAYKLLILGQFLANTFLIGCVHQFLYALYLLRQQFACVNESLRLWQLEARAWQTNKQTLQTHSPQELYTDLRVRLTELIQMHADYQRLAVRVFKLFALPFAGFLMRQFGVSINMLFSAVIIGSLFVALFYTDVLLLMSFVNGVVDDCNAAAQMLRECTTMVSVGEPHAVLERQLESFSLRLSCHPLCYKVFGLFEFNRSECLNCLCTILVYITVLMQFDMNKERMSNF